MSNRVRMIGVKRIVELMGGPVRIKLQPSDWDGPRATPGQILALAHWRVYAPERTPRGKVSARPATAPQSI